MMDALTDTKEIKWEEHSDKRAVFFLSGSVVSQKPPSSPAKKAPKKKQQTLFSSYWDADAGEILLLAERIMELKCDNFWGGIVLVKEWKKETKKEWGVVSVNAHGFEAPFTISHDKSKSDKKGTASYKYEVWTSDETRLLAVTPTILPKTHRTLTSGAYKSWVPISYAVVGYVPWSKQMELESALYSMELYYKSNTENLHPDKIRQNINRQGKHKNTNGNNKLLANHANSKDKDIEEFELDSVEIISVEPSSVIADSSVCQYVWICFKNLPSQLASSVVITIGDDNAIPLQFFLNDKTSRIGVIPPNKAEGSYSISHSFPHSHDPTPNLSPLSLSYKPKPQLPLPQIKQTVNEEEELEEYVEKCNKTVNQIGNLPLHYACCSGYWKMVVELLTNNEEGLTKGNKDGYTPIDYAILMRFRSLAFFLIQVLGYCIIDNEKFSETILDRCFAEDETIGLLNQFKNENIKNDFTKKEGYLDLTKRHNKPPDCSSDREPEKKIHKKARKSWKHRKKILKEKKQIKEKKKDKEKTGEEAGKKRGKRDKQRESFGKRRSISGEVYPIIDSKDKHHTGSATRPKSTGNIRQPINPKKHPPMLSRSPSGAPSSGGKKREDILNAHSKLQEFWGKGGKQSEIIVDSAVPTALPSLMGAILEATMKKFEEVTKCKNMTQVDCKFIHQLVEEVCQHVHRDSIGDFVKLETLNNLVESRFTDKILEEYESFKESASCEEEEFPFEYEIACGSHKGVRPSNEDCFTILKHFNTLLGLPSQPTQIYFALFDGHSGVEAAHYCKKQLHVNICFELAASPDDFEQSLINAFEQTDKDFNEMAMQHDTSSGTTAMVGFLRKDKLIIANCGDARGFIHYPPLKKAEEKKKKKKERKSVKEEKKGKRAIVTNDWGLTKEEEQDPSIVPICTIQKPEREDEKARIKEAGGMVVWFGTWRVNALLGVARSIGDHKLSNCVIPTPELNSLSFNPSPGSFLVMATDGLWDVMTYREVADYVTSYFEENVNASKQSVIDALTAEAIDERDSRDNVTILIVFFKTK
eukprot:CAMPEP_0174254314 /NCGR_PEP_ID=MMETSP0439-20130205/3651_1 /TAXON_ID=0 /ORGANISM="Stereomyxa ramosa, Strain Chinc5" /LENGTH=1039 /DNA_ID=CAMNT_0015335829 /DNA_START=134 /DNA_END=3253 /DNA_ORIENTATION=-